jgi:hypothetical protein
MWDPQRLTTLWAFTACYRDSFTFFYLLWTMKSISMKYLGHMELIKSRFLRDVTRNSRKNKLPTFLSLQAEDVRSWENDYLPTDVNKKILFERFQCWYYWWERFRKYVVDMISSGMIYTTRIMMIGSGIQVTSRFLLQKFERLQCWHYWERDLWNASGGKVHISSFMQICSGIQGILKSISEPFKRLQCLY